MRLYTNKYECCGCTACMNICPKTAINMFHDEEGFCYPRINKDLCINCKLCLKVCPLKDIDNELEFKQGIKVNKLNKKMLGNSNLEIKESKQVYFAAQHKNNEILYSSPSGGIFTALSDYIIEREGVIFGAAFDQNFVVKHMKATNKLDRDKFKGSKYVQSDLSDIFKEIKKELLNNQYVMFTGTPCQNAGLKNYLEKSHIDCKKLYMCDFICHGVPSPLIWKEYVEYLESKFDDKLISFSFRSKKNGWKNMSLSAEYKKNDFSNECNKKYSFLNLFTSLLIVRPSCFRCKFTKYNRKPDITLADFWNIGPVKPDFDKDDGVSSVIITTEKGREWFDNVKGKLQYEECTKEECWQPHLEYPIIEPKNRNKFWNEYKNEGIKYIVNKYGRGTFSTRMKKKLTPIIKKLGLYVLAGKVYKRIFLNK